MAALGLPQLIRSAKEFGGQVESAGELVAAAWKSGLADRVVRLWVRCPWMKRSSRDDSSVACGVQRRRSDSANHVNRLNCRHWTACGSSRLWCHRVRIVTREQWAFCTWTAVDSFSVRRAFSKGCWVIWT